MKKYAFCIMAGIALAFCSCEPEAPKPIKQNTGTPNTTPNDTVPKIKYVTAKSWRLTGLAQGSTGSSNTSDLYQSGYPNCQKDDLYTFTAPDILLVGTGQSKCGSNDAEKTGTWELNNSSTAMNLTIPSQTMVGMTGNFAVLELTSSKMILSQTVNNSTYFLTFTAQ